MFTRFGTHDAFNAQLICSVPVRFQPPNTVARWAWKSPQTVNVLFYRNDFTADERNEIRLAFQDWEIAANQDCAQVHFTGFIEDNTPPFQGTTLNTHYVFRADPAPGYAASTTNHAGRRSHAP